MATKAAAKETEKIYECEVKRRRVSARGGYEPFWKVKEVAEALIDGDTEFRCKECHGGVKLFRKRVANGAAPHAEHLSRQDSEYCPMGMYFRQATDGRTARLSEAPVN